MHYDFIEVGTSDFDTLCQSCSDRELGISIEPVKDCIDNLPNRSNVKKVVAALVTEEYFASNKHVNTFYIDKETIEANQLGSWIRGCNQINAPHNMHLHYIEDLNVYYGVNKEQLNLLCTRNLVEEGLVISSTTKSITWSKLFNEFDVTSIGYVKIDAEGHDPYIVMSLMKECIRRKNINLFPKSIRFELTDGDVMQEAVDMLQDNNYHAIIDPLCLHDVVAERISLSDNNTDVYQKLILY